jgi:hypothetical protein
MRIQHFIILSIMMCMNGQTTGSARIQSPSVFDNGKAGFTIRFGSEVTPYHVTGVFVLPGHQMEIEIREQVPGIRYTMHSESGQFRRLSDASWSLQLPQKHGLYPVRITDPAAEKSILLNIFVMIPRNQKKGEYLNGYRIGKYPLNPLNGLVSYHAPAGFIEVTPENENTLISPNFTLKQFLCKQDGGYPKYVVLRERLLMKLEVLLEETNKQGIQSGSFTVMSGYRTPYYNKAIGNSQYSRHVYGDAADIFIDTNPRSGVMDDLNGDGKTDFKDAAVLYDLIDGLYHQPWYRKYIGGLGAYKERYPTRGAFVHVDARGTRARWGR